MEKRRFTRVGFTIYANVAFKDDLLQGVVDNISLHGLFVKDVHEIGIGSEVKISMVLSPIDPKIVIRGVAVAVRSEPEGTGFEFKRMGVDSFMHLRKIVSYATSDGDAIMGEFAAYVDHKMHEEA